MRQSKLTLLTQCMNNSVSNSVHWQILPQIFTGQFLNWLCFRCVLLLQSLCFLKWSSSLYPHLHTQFLYLNHASQSIKPEQKQSGWLFQLFCVWAILAQKNEDVHQIFGCPSSKSTSTPQINWDTVPPPPPPPPPHTHTQVGAKGWSNYCIDWNLTHQNSVMGPN